MKHNTWMIAAAIACATTMAKAQSPTTSSSSMDDKNKVTVTGCLQDLRSGSTAGGSSTATTGSTAASGATGSGQYMLANAMMSGGASTGSTSGSVTGTASGATATASAAGSTTGTSGTTGVASGGTSSSGKSYVLEGRDSELTNHVGHQVEVTGSIETQPSSESSTTATAGSASASSSMMSNGNRLKVSSVRMISSSCTAK